jgi:2-succinyl-5-enolpyruvyl-6-hydroxy-3-cyclohexene-1-carboxylate synthase
MRHDEFACREETNVSAPALLDYRNTNSLWGGVLVETLYRLGLRQVVISPGSRSTALTIAFARHGGIEAIPVLDERSAAFFALGLAKGGSRAVALVCTSGTAGANYFPAIIEAQESGVPLLVITADRPPEMRECRSGQTIDQQKLYGSHVNFYHEFAVPVADLPMLQYLRQTLIHAWERTQWPDAGPVHLNAPFRDPLAPIENDSAKRLQKLLREEVFFADVQPPIRVSARVEPTGFPFAAKRGIIIAGPMEDSASPEYASIVAGLARDLGWPVLADGLSGLRGASGQFPSFITHYDAIVRSKRALSRLKPDVVLCLGGWPTSKPLRVWLEKCAPKVWLLSKRVQNQDALHLATRHLRCGVGEFASSLGSPGNTTSDYVAAWREAESAAARSFARSLAKADKFEGMAVVNLAQALPASTPVFVANSMPVRDLEYFWPANERSHRIYFNRGANGIDGTLSSALGVAHDNLPAVLLTGDLALLHDTNGFLLKPRFRGGLTIVLINNNGGGIFEHLPVAQFDPPFEEFFATPQEVSFSKLAGAYGVPHVLVRDWRHFAGLMAKLPKRGIRVLEIRTDRKADAAFRKKLFADAADAVENALS